MKIGVEFTRELSCPIRPRGRTAGVTRPRGRAHARGRPRYARTFRPRGRTAGVFKSARGQTRPHFARAGVLWWKIVIFDFLFVINKNMSFMLVFNSNSIGIDKLVWKHDFFDFFTFGAKLMWEIMENH